MDSITSTTTNSIINNNNNTTLVSSQDNELETITEKHMINFQQESTTTTFNLNKRISIATQWQNIFKRQKLKAGISVGYGFSSEDNKWETLKIPHYKRIAGTSFAVDAFNYGKLPGISDYFLTHFHSDHYCGLTSKFDYGPIHCSLITAKLLRKKLYIKEEFIRVIPLNQKTEISPNSFVTFIDAFHCPGAIMILFELVESKNTKIILHTGDFRANDQVHSSLKKIKAFDLIYLDTTYCDPKYTFPSQQEILDYLTYVSKDLILNRKLRVMFVVGTYCIGKEKVFKTISKALNNCPIQVSPSKMKVLECISSDRNNEEVYVTTTTPNTKVKVNDTSPCTNKPKPMVHVVGMNELVIESLVARLDQHKEDFDFLLAVRPTGWAFVPQTRKQKVLQIPNWIKDQCKNPLIFQNKSTCDRVCLVEISYSEHSSYKELQRFIQGLPKVKTIIPTVYSSKSTETKLKKIFNTWIRN